MIKFYKFYRTKLLKSMDSAQDNGDYEKARELTEELIEFDEKYIELPDGKIITIEEHYGEVPINESVLQ